MRIGFHGQILDEPVIRAGFIGCGSHSFRNIYPALQFAPVQLVATCDLNAERSAAFAQRFGALRSYTDYHRMLGAEEPATSRISSTVAVPVLRRNLIITSQRRFSASAIPHRF